MLGARLVEGKIGNRDSAVGGGGELDLCFLSSFTNTLDSSFILRDVNTWLGFEFTDEVLLDLDVEIFTTEGSVSISRFDLKHTTWDLENRDIKSTTTKIVNSDNFTIGLIKTESESSRSWFVDDTLDLEVSDLASVFSSLTLRVVKVSGNSHNSLFDGATEVSLWRFFHLC